MSWKKTIHLLTSWVINTYSLLTSLQCQADCRDQIIILSLNWYMYDMYQLIVQLHVPCSYMYMYNYSYFKPKCVMVCTLLDKSYPAVQHSSHRCTLHSWWRTLSDNALQQLPQYLCSSTTSVAPVVWTTMNVHQKLAGVRKCSLVFSTLKFDNSLHPGVQCTHVKLTGYWRTVSKATWEKAEIKVLYYSSSDYWESRQQLQAKKSLKKWTEKRY